MMTRIGYHVEFLCDLSWETGLEDDGHENNQKDGPHEEVGGVTHPDRRRSELDGKRRRDRGGNDPTGSHEADEQPFFPGDPAAGRREENEQRANQKGDHGDVPESAETETQQGVEIQQSGQRDEHEREDGQRHVTLDSEMSVL